MTRAPRKKPASGDVIIGTTTFGQSPLFHFNTDQFPRAVASAAPQSPPISAWLELDGKPTHQVVIFQAKAAMSAHSTVAMVTKLVSTKPFPMVEATAPPKRAPVKLKIAAITIACRGVSTLVETTVANGVRGVVKPVTVFENNRRSEERRVGKECRSRWTREE